jgi:hypothetical protein
VQRLERLQLIAKKTALSSESALRDAVTQLHQIQQQHQQCSTTDRTQQQHAATADAQLQTEECVSIYALTYHIFKYSCCICDAPSLNAHTAM